MKKKTAANKVYLSMASIRQPLQVHRPLVDIENHPAACLFFKQHRGKLKNWKRKSTP